MAEEKTPQTEEEIKDTAKKTAKPKKNTENEKLKSEIEKLTEELKAKEDLLLRTAAEFDNYKKRTEKEKLALAEYAKATLCKQLLPILDNSDRAAEFEQGSEQYNKGIEMIVKLLLELSDKLGLTVIGEVGETFDPNIHDAIMHIEDETLGENTVAQVLQKGYKLGDTVVRPAMVQVAN